MRSRTGNFSIGEKSILCQSISVVSCKLSPRAGRTIRGPPSRIPRHSRLSSEPQLEYTFLDTARARCALEERRKEKSPTPSVSPPPPSSFFFRYYSSPSPLDRSLYTIPRNRHLSILNFNYSTDYK